MFKIGNKVKLKDDLVEGEIYGGIEYLKSMERYKHSNLTIRYISEEEKTVRTENTNFWFSFEMIEKEEFTMEETQYSGDLNTSIRSYLKSGSYYGDLMARNTHIVDYTGPFKKIGHNRYIIPDRPKTKFTYEMTNAYLEDFQINIGDTVELSDNLELGKSYGGIEFTSEHDLIGKYLVIENKNMDHGNERFKIKDDTFNSTFSREMFVFNKYRTKKESDFIDVKIRWDLKNNKKYGGITLTPGHEIDAEIPLKREDFNIYKSLSGKYYTYEMTEQYIKDVNSIKVGDRVKLKDDLIVHKTYEDKPFIKGMKTEDNFVTIEDIYAGTFYVKENIHHYTAEMFDIPNKLEDRFMKGEVPMEKDLKLYWDYKASEDKIVMVAYKTDVPVDPDLTFKTGVHKGKKIVDIYKKDPKYLHNLVSLRGLGVLAGMKGLSEEEKIKYKSEPYTLHGELVHKHEIDFLSKESALMLKKAKLDPYEMNLWKRGLKFAIKENIAEPIEKEFIIEYEDGTKEILNSETHTVVKLDDTAIIKGYL